MPTTLDFNHHALQGGIVRYIEVQPAIHPTIGRALGGYKAVHLLHGPFLEVVFVPLPQVAGTFGVAGNTFNGEVSIFL